jgi:hypothetical protein
MTKQLNEYKELPKLSESAISYLENRIIGEPVPDDIRVELETYVLNSQPYIDDLSKQISENLDKAFHQ